MTQEQAAQIAGTNQLVYVPTRTGVAEATIVEVDGRYRAAMATETVRAHYAYASRAEAEERFAGEEAQRQATEAERKARARKRFAGHTHRWQWLSHEEQRCTICGNIRFMQDE
jgi:hypothetical protein